MAIGWVTLAAAVLGAIFGSFIATLVVRWPEGRSVMQGRSCCDHCGHQPGALELIPLLSWLVLYGKCRECGGRINPIHPLTELIAAAMTALGVILWPFPQSLALLFFALLSLPLILLDFRHYWLPDRLTILLAAAGLGVTSWLVLDALWLRLAGAVFAFMLLEGVRRGYRHWRGVEGMGAGDPKLFAAVALWISPYQLPFVLLLASGGGIIWYLLTRAKAPQRFPLGGLLLLGALLIMAINPDLIR